ncbi:MAG: hypothetical protein ACP5Q4_02820 [Candidatus Caldatribacteriaceae bacterium]
MKMKIKMNQSLYQRTLSVPLLLEDLQGLPLVSFANPGKHRECGGRHSVPFLKEPLRESS